MNTFREYFIETITKRYADFSGRASRSEYWYFVLFNFIISLVLYIPILMTMITMFEDPYAYLEPGAISPAMSIFSLLYTVYSLAIIIPSLALLARRLHDVGRSGWSFLICLVPLVGVIVLLVWLCTESQPGPNKWGQNPWGVGNHKASESLVSEF